MVKLSLRDHYRAHELLPFFCKGSDKYLMLSAWNLMGRIKESTYVDNATLRGEYKKLMSMRMTGKVVAKDKDGNIFHIVVDDPRFISGELVGINMGKMAVRDEDGNNLQVDVDDPRLLSGELTSVTKGKVTVKDKDGNNLQVSIDDPRFISGELVGVAQGKINVRDKDGNNFQVSENDPRWLSGELTHPAKDLISVKDKDGNSFSVSIDDPRFISGELVGVTKNYITIHNPETGKKKSQPSAEVIPDGWKLGSGLFGKNSTRFERVIELNKDTLEIERVWDCVKHASQYHNTDGSSIAMAARGVYQTSAGSRWVYVKNLDKHPEIKIKYQEFKKSN